LRAGLEALAELARDARGFALGFATELEGLGRPAIVASQIDRALAIASITAEGLEALAADARAAMTQPKGSRTFISGTRSLEWLVLQVEHLQDDLDQLRSISLARVEDVFKQLAQRGYWERAAIEDAGDTGPAQQGNIESIVSQLDD
jgi:hypothetical protein